jgi:hypothetical protein
MGGSNEYHPPAMTWGKNLGGAYAVKMCMSDGLGIIYSFNQVNK